MIRSVLVYECDICGKHKEIKGPKVRKAIPPLPKGWKRAQFMITFTLPDGRSKGQAADRIHLCPHCYNRYHCKEIKVKKVDSNEHTS